MTPSLSAQTQGEQVKRHKTVLWAGPQDGLEVEVEAAQRKVYITDGVNPNPGATWADVELWKSMKGIYTLNTKTGRFEWTGWFDSDYKEPAYT